MSSPLPEYSPPNQQRTALAARLAPLLMLLAFAAVLVKWVDPELGFAAFAACTSWVVYEMHVYQTTIDAYNESYIGLHLAWRSSEALQVALDSTPVKRETRVFVSHFLQAQADMLADTAVR